MKNFRVFVDGERLHIVVDGYQATDLKELCNILADFAMSKDGAKMTENRLDDFEPAPSAESIPVPPVEVASPKPVKDESPAEEKEEKNEVTESTESERLYKKYLSGMKEKNESFIQKAFARDGGIMSFLTPEQKEAFKKAFKEWFKDRYTDDPFKGDIRLQKGFLKLYVKYIEEELKSLEEQMGFASGSFVKSADDDQITVAYDICRERMLQRSCA